jgi:hypothetical protein
VIYYSHSIVKQQGNSPHKETTIMARASITEITKTELGRIKATMGIKRDALTDAEEIAGWDAARASRDAREAARMAAAIAAGYMTPDGAPIIPAGDDDKA